MLLITTVLTIMTMFPGSVVGDCTCTKKHPQQDVCTSDIVIKAKVEATRINQFNVPTNFMIDPVFSVKERQYKVRVRRIIKGKVTHRRNVYIFTPAGNSSCEASFDVGKFYLITGNYRGPEANLFLQHKYRKSTRINVNSCNWISEWSKLSIFQRNAVRSRYLSNCKCSILKCGYGNCDASTRAVWSPQSQNKCLEKFAICQNINGLCCWKNTQRLRRCLRNNKT